MASVNNLSWLTFELLQTVSRELDASLKKENVSFEIFCSNLVSQGKSSWREPETLRGMFRDLYQRHIEDLTKKYFQNRPLKVLELGAGFLKEGRSALSRHFPQDIHFTYSDKDIKAALASKKENASIPYLYLDSSRLDKTIQPSSLDAVVASCFLDTLPGQTLTRTLEQVSSVLKEDGLLVHVADLEPFLDTFVIHHLDHPGIMFPLIEERTVKGLQFVAEEALKSYCDMDKSFEASSLREYIKVSKDARAAFTVEICKIAQFAIFLSQFVTQKFPEQRVEILTEGFFSQRLLEELGKTNFELLGMGEQLQESITPKTATDVKDGNFVSSLQGRVLERQIELPSGMIKKALGIHLMVARKKKDLTVYDL